MLFSQRMGLKPAGKLAQREAIDEDLRSKIWNVMTLQLWNRWEPQPEAYSMHDQSVDAKRIDEMLQALWFKYFKKPLDSQPRFKTSNASSYYDLLRSYVLNNEWNEVFDLMESIVRLMHEGWREEFIDFINDVLKDESSAYRIVVLSVMEITDENEISSVKEGVTTGSSSVRSHLKRSLELLTDRNSPDYRNSIKESISAVEAICQEITGKTSATLSQCLGSIKEKRNIHPALEQSLLKLYGFTSDSGGIRHAMSDADVMPTYSEAKFMLVSCSAVTNYLRTMQTE